MHYLGTYLKCVICLLWLTLWEFLLYAYVIFLFFLLLFDFVHTLCCLDWYTLVKIFRYWSFGLVGVCCRSCMSSISVRYMIFFLSLFFLAKALKCWSTWATWYEVDQNLYRYNMFLFLCSHSLSNFFFFWSLVSTPLFLMAKLFYFISQNVFNPKNLFLAQNYI